MLKNVTFLLIVSFLTSASFGQTAVIKGSVRNYQTTAHIPGATVTLKSIKDTSIVHTRVSDSLGRFIFNELPLDSFRLSITSVGFTPFTKTVRSDTALVDLGPLDLKNASSVLAGVTVTAN